MPDGAPATQAAHATHPVATGTLADFYGPPPPAPSSKAREEPPAPPEEEESIPLESLGFPAGLLKALLDASIDSTAKLVAMEDKELAEIKGLGPKRIERIQQVLASHGLQTLSD